MNKTRVCIITTTVQQHTGESPIQHSICKWRDHVQEIPQDMYQNTEAVSGIQQGHKIQVSIHKLYIYVLTSNNVRCLGVKLAILCKPVHWKLWT